jgi:hypothetical protein
MMRRQGADERRWLLDQSNRTLAEEIQFGLWFLKVGLLFGFAALVNNLAKGARVSPAECLFERDRNGFRPGKLDGHANPGNRLEEEPMAPCGKDDGQDHKPSA